jgi:hypothetical protein
VAPQSHLPSSWGRQRPPSRSSTYVSAAERLTAYLQDDADHYHEIARVDTHGGKTSVLVPSLNQLYFPHTKTSAPEAGLEIYKVM